MGSEAVAEPTSGLLENTDSETGEKKADFLFGKPKIFLGLHFGLFFPQADSEVFDMITSELTLEESDFDAWDLGFDVGFDLHEKLDLVFRFDYSSESAGSEFREFVDEQGLPITLPRSEAGEKIPREKIAHVWIDQRGTLLIDDLVVSMDDIEPLNTRKMRENPGLIISFNTDDAAQYKVVNESMERLKLANALRVSFTTMPEGG